MIYDAKNKPWSDEECGLCIDEGGGWSGLFKRECSRAFLGKNFALAVVVGIFLCSIGIMLVGLPRPLVADEAYFPWVFGLEAYSFLVPLISVWPFADTYALECNSGYLTFVRIRTDHSRYVKSKMLINAIIGGVATCIPSFIYTIFTLSIYPETIDPSNQIGGAFSRLLPEHFELYAFLYVLLHFVFGVVYATFGFALSLYLRQRYLILTIPFLFYHLFNVVFSQIEVLTAWKPPSTFLPHTSGFTTW